VLRYNLDGSLDSTFGVNGIVITDFSGNDDIARGIVIQGDNQIVVAGGSGDDFAIARYNSDGSLDSTFGIGGKVTTDFFGGNDRGSDIALQSDGRIVVAGQVETQAGNQTTLDFGLARYNTDGSLDSSFGLGGMTTTDFLGQADFAFAVTIQSNGRIVAAGGATIAGAPFTDFAVARYETNGSLDQSFGIGGKVMTDFFGRNDFAYDVVIQIDGRIVAAGQAELVQGGVVQQDFALARYLGDPPLLFNICLQDDDAGDTLQFNSINGVYLFTQCGPRGLTLGGTGVVRSDRCNISLEDSTADHRVEATINACHDKGKASVKILRPGTTFTVKDKDTSNNTCLCR